MMQTDTTTLRSLADDIDAMRHQIRQRDATIILLQAELDTLRRENALLRSGIDIAGEYNAGAALGMAIPSEARDIGFGVPVV